MKRQTNKVFKTDIIFDNFSELINTLFCKGVKPYQKENEANFFRSLNFYHRGRMCKP